MKKGSAKSIRTSLKNISDSKQTKFQFITTRFFHERLLYRLAISKFANNFILKGGELLYAIEGFHIRPTMDIDMLANKISNDMEEIKQIFQTICSVKYDDDCVILDTESIETIKILEKDKYSGIRVFINASLDTIRQRLQIDIGFSDIITPAPINLSYPVLLDELETPEIKAYSIETVIAEKFQTMIALGIFNSRMKDFYDVYTLLKNSNINSENLSEAIFQTFKNRNTDFADNQDNHEFFKQSFRKDEKRQAMWKAFLRKTNISENLKFSDVMENILETLQPIYNDLIDRRLEAVC